MLYISFVSAADASMLAIVAARLRKLDPDAVIYAISDPAAPLQAAQVPEGVQHRLGTVNRGGNLNGLPIIAEELQTFLALMDATGEKSCIKIDADCYPISLQPLLDDADMCICERAEPLTPAGMIYRISRDMTAAILELFTARVAAGEWVEGAQYPEDRTIWQLALHTRRPCCMLSYSGKFAAAATDDAPDDIPIRVRSVSFIHCGEPLPNGQRIPREHATLRMRCLDAAIRDSIPL